MEKTDRIYVAGHRGMVGGAILRNLEASGYVDVLTATREQLDLTDQHAVRAWFEEIRPDYVFLAAAKVGGIQANISSPATFIYDNLMIQTNVIHSAYLSSVKKLEFLGSSCIYPRESKQPMKEEYILTGPMEPTNEAYAVAKIAGLKMCEFYRRQYGFNAITIVPPNLYGPGDDFSIEKSHVIAALIRRFHEAKVQGKKSVTLWGTGSARREFMYVEDLADAAVYLMNEYDDDQFINVGTSSDMSILDLAELVKETVGFKGSIKLDKSKPDGMPRKLMDSSRFGRLTWNRITDIRTGLRLTYEWLLANPEVMP
ncbi:MAG: GDP-fucose synthetase [Candidatus Thorarchaeota archaeon]|nr:MAG: GDP-fucose synthetase [Candidatus Thorarchaeota archaeon]